MDDEDSSFPPTEPVSISQRPTASFRPSANGTEDAFFSARQKSHAPGLPSLPAPPLRPKPSRARSMLSKLLFATLFGGISMLLGYALLQRMGG